MKNLFSLNDDISKDLEAEIQHVKSFMYIGPTIEEYENRIKKHIISGHSPSHAHIFVLNEITSIMKTSEKKVNEIIKDRLNNGYIKDAMQARRNAAGNNFQGIISYCIIMNVLYKNIPNLMVVCQPKRRKKYKKIIDKNLQIEILDEIQKPDCDILIFNPKNQNAPIVVGSCKTSIRERAGQAYRWKLLYDLCNCRCEYIDRSSSCLVQKYCLQNVNKRDVMYGLISSDLYDEFSRPQNKGMASFFDFCFLTKDIEESKNIKKMGKIIEYLNNIFS